MLVGRHTAINGGGDVRIIVESTKKKDKQKRPDEKRCDIVKNDVNYQL